MTGKSKGDDSVSDEEAVRRRDEALRRALAMPPKPRQADKANAPKLAKRTSGKGRSRVGKSRS